MNKLLIIVDPQVDFIQGSLPIRGAKEAMNNLASYINDHDGDYCCKVVTIDWHPYRHCSFDINGGQWPVHCVSHTRGSSIWQEVMHALITTKGELEILHKGVNEDTDEYSIFMNKESSLRLKEIIEVNKIEQIDICGLAGDICLLNTLKDGVAIYGKKMFQVLTQYSPSLDGGLALNEYINTLCK